VNAIIYDIEILRSVPNKDGSKVEGIEYCAGWHDHANMGITVIGAYDYTEDRYRVFCKDNFQRFLARATQPDTLLVGFNNIPFDNAVIGAELRIPLPEVICYDLLRETWVASGLGQKFEYPSHIGYSLDAICARNFGTTKTGDGSLAPVLWQRGEIGAVIDYCLNDVRLTKQLFDAVRRGQPILSPRDGNPLTLRHPFPEKAAA